MVLMGNRVIKLTMTLVHCHFRVNIKDLMGNILELMPIIVVVVVNHN